jgi:hypothetical protein
LFIQIKIRKRSDKMAIKVRKGIDFTVVGLVATIVIASGTIHGLPILKQTELWSKNLLIFTFCKYN